MLEFEDVHGELLQINVHWSVDSNNKLNLGVTIVFRMQNGANASISSIFIEPYLLEKVYNRYYYDPSDPYARRWPWLYHLVMQEVYNSQKQNLATNDQVLREKLSTLTPALEESSSDFIVKNGQLTFDAEGRERGKYHSRKPHVPDDNSGVTIGRGYDMKNRTSASINADLISAGLSLNDAEAYSLAAGLSGDEAKNFINQHQELVEITTLQQKKLFELEYSRMTNDVIRICNKSDVVEVYGATNWDNLHPAIKEVVIDLRFRGDYNSTSRAIIQKNIADNDFVAFYEKLSNRTNWPNVPVDRFNRRVDYLNRARQQNNTFGSGRFIIFANNHLHTSSKDSDLKSHPRPKL